MKITILKPNNGILGVGISAMGYQIECLPKRIFPNEFARPMVATEVHRLSALKHSRVGGWLLSLSKTASQSGDHAAAAVALQPAWEALEANLHKAPLSPAQPGGPHVGSAAAAQQQQQQAGCPFLLRFTAAWVYVAMATAGVSLFEKQKRYEEACDTIRKLLGEAQDSFVDLERGRPKTRYFVLKLLRPDLEEPTQSRTVITGRSAWQWCVQMQLSTT